MLHHQLKWLWLIRFSLLVLPVCTGTEIQVKVETGSLFSIQLSDTEVGTGTGTGTSVDVSSINTNSISSDIQSQSVQNINPDDNTSYLNPSYPWLRITSINPILVQGIGPKTLGKYSSTLEINEPSSLADGKKTILISILVVEPKHSPGVTGMKKRKKVNGVPWCLRKKSYSLPLLNFDRKIEEGNAVCPITRDQNVGVWFHDSSVLGTSMYYWIHCNPRFRRVPKKGRGPSHNDRDHDDDDEESIFGSGNGENDYDDEDEDDLDHDEHEDDFEEADLTHELPIVPTPTLNNYYETTTTNDPAPPMASTEILPTPTTEFEPLFPSASIGEPIDFVGELGSGIGPLPDTNIQPTPVLDLDNLGPGATATMPTPPEEESPYQPHLRTHLPKHLLIGGKVYKFNLDNNYFTTSSPNGLEFSLGPNSPNWLRIIEGNLLVGWPSFNEISDYKVNLTIRNKDMKEMKLDYDMDFVVRQSQKSKLWNHEFELRFRKQSHGPDLWKIIQSIKYFGRKGTSSRNIPDPKTTNGIETEINSDDMIVTELKDDGGGIWRIKWVNETLVDGDFAGVCPVTELNQIYNHLASSDGIPKSSFSSYLSPYFTPNLLSITLSSHCEGKKLQEITGSSGRENSHDHHLPPKENFPPRIIVAIDKLNATSGIYFIYQVPENFCNDPENGGTRSLTLELYDKNRGKIDGGDEVEKQNQWLQFDVKNQEFYGLPPPTGSGSNDPRSVLVDEYVLSCKDEENKTANDALELYIQPQNPEANQLLAEFRIHFTITSSAGIGHSSSNSLLTPRLLRKFISTLASVFNSTVNTIAVKSYQSSGNSVQFLWANTTNPKTEYDVTQLRKIMLNDDSSIKNSFLNAFKPDFNISWAQIIPKGKLLVGPDLGSGTGDGLGGDMENDNGLDLDSTVTIVDTERKDEEGSYLMTYIIPSALIAVMILLAALIACCLSRKKKSVPGKNFNSEEHKKFIKKGVPVIFQDEMEDEKQMVVGGSFTRSGSASRSRSPAILPSEHPPLPPEYRRSPIDHLYNPPPPPSTSRQSLSRGQQQQAPMGYNPRIGMGPSPGPGSAPMYRRPPPPYGLN